MATGWGGLMLQMSRFPPPDSGLHARFLASAARRTQDLRLHLNELVGHPNSRHSESRHPDEGVMALASRELHILKGDAKLLGFDAIFRAAEGLEERLESGSAGEPSVLASAIRGELDALDVLIAAGDVEATPRPSGETSIRQGIRADGQPWRILLIDDSDIALEVQRDLLTGDGFEVRATTSLGTFDELLEDWCPQLILADVDMPTLSGPELCRMLKSRYDTAHVPIVLCSALSIDRLKQLARDCEAEGYVSKARLESLAEDLHELCEAMAW